MFGTCLLAITLGQLPQSTLDVDYPAPPIVLAPVVIDQSTQARIDALESRVAALEAQHARLGLQSAPVAAPVAGAAYSDTACAGGNCGAPGRSYRFAPFGGRF